jgi:hypothetical protein
MAFHLLLYRKTNIRLHALQPNRPHILINLVERILEAFDVIFPHQRTKLNDTCGADADADFQG